VATAIEDRQASCRGIGLCDGEGQAVLSDNLRVLHQTQQLDEALHGLTAGSICSRPQSPGRTPQLIRGMTTGVHFTRVGKIMMGSPAHCNRRCNENAVSL
jgi:hypothetical protein